MFTVWCESCNGALWSTHNTRADAERARREHDAKHWEHDGYLPESYVDGGE